MKKARLENNEVIKHFEKIIDSRALIFNDENYKDYLKCVLADDKFEGYFKAFFEVKSDVSLEKVNACLLEIEKEYGFDLSKQKEIVATKIEEKQLANQSLDAKRVLDGFEGELTRYDVSDDRIREIEKKLAIYSSIPDDYIYKRVEEISDKIKKLNETRDIELNYNKNMNNMVANGFIWSGVYGNNTYNLTYPEEIIDDIEKDDNIPSVTCELLNLERRFTPFIGKTFSPLMVLDTIVLSEDGKSVTFYDKNLKPIPDCKFVLPDDELAGSGAIMYLSSDKYYFIIPGKKKPYILDKNCKSININSWDTSLEKTDEIFISSIHAFRNKCYVNVCNSKLNKSTIYLIKCFDSDKGDSFKMTKSDMEPRIIGNLSLVFNTDEKKLYVFYITKDENKTMFVSLNSETLEINSKPTAMKNCPAPWDVTLPFENKEYREYITLSPIVYYGGYLWYATRKEGSIGAANSMAKNLNIVRISPFELGDDFAKVFGVNTQFEEFFPIAFSAFNSSVIAYSLLQNQAFYLENKNNDDEMEIKRINKLFYKEINIRLIFMINTNSGKKFSEDNVKPVATVYDDTSKKDHPYRIIARYKNRFVLCRINEGKYTISLSNPVYNRGDDLNE